MILTAHEHARNMGAHFADDENYLDTLDTYYQEIVADNEAEGQFGDVVEKLRWGCANILRAAYQDGLIESDFDVNEMTNSIFLGDLAMILLAEWTRP